jgi:secondary thiamine-phosphate synthase enzyme
MESVEIVVGTGTEIVVDLTTELEQFCSGRGDGLVNVFVPHATAGLALIETGSRSEPDLQAAVDALLPLDRTYRHRHGSPGHGRDHVLPAFISPSVTIPVIDGALVLGVWQHVVIVDTNVDNARRRVRMSFIG